MSELNTPFSFNNDTKTIVDCNSMFFIDCHKSDAPDIIERLNNFDRLEQENDRLKARVAELEEFTSNVVRSYCWGHEIDGGDIQEMALAAGIISKTEFNPAIHDDYGYGMDEGDDYYVFSEGGQQSLSSIQPDNTHIDGLFKLFIYEYIGLDGELSGEDMIYIKARYLDFRIEKLCSNVIEDK